MKKLFLLCLISLFMVAGLASCNDNDTNEVEEEITFSELPMTAQTFVKTYFSEYEIAKILKDVEGVVTIYEVKFSNGYQAEFNNEGIWQQVAAPYGEKIPTGFIPGPIMSTLNRDYQGFGINVINKQGEYYKIVLTDNQGGNSISLLFNMSGEIMNNPDNM